MVSAFQVQEEDRGITGRMDIDGWHTVSATWTTFVAITMELGMDMAQVSQVVGICPHFFV